uniref:Uncharacterized protein n=1 Tax=Clastoptera arizonana TaxID=38151 RepID=A0A1B6C3R5_9HEMI
MELDWCHHLINILQKQVVVQDLNSVSVDNKHYRKQLNHDDIEKIINSIISLFNHCLSDFKNNLLFKEIISNLESWYMVLSEEEVAHGDSDLYFTSLFKKIRHITISLT